MAYFSNGSEGMVFDDQCARCKYGMKPCPIALVQMEYNYVAANNPVARQILDTLVHNDGTCAMFKEFEEDLSFTAGPLFPELVPKITRVWDRDQE